MEALEPTFDAAFNEFSAPGIVQQGAKGGLDTALFQFFSKTIPKKELACYVVL